MEKGLDTEWEREGGRGERECNWNCEWVSEYSFARISKSLLREMNSCAELHTYVHILSLSLSFYRRIGFESVPAFSFFTSFLGHGIFYLRTWNISSTLEKLIRQPFIHGFHVHALSFDAPSARDLRIPPRDFLRIFENTFQRFPSISNRVARIRFENRDSSLYEVFDPWCVFNPFGYSKSFDSFSFFFLFWKVSYNCERISLQIGRAFVTPTTKETI